MSLPLKWLWASTFLGCPAKHVTKIGFAFGFKSHRVTESQSHRGEGLKRGRLRSAVLIGKRWDYW